jgi:CNT family concentrative nucleoside transporter
MGIKASYLLTASIMAAPGALVIAKIVWPETEESKTKGNVQIEVKKTNVNIIDAAAHGASDGLRIGLNVAAMLIAFIALISMVDAGLGLLGKQAVALGAPHLVLGMDLSALKLQDIFGVIFAPVAWLLGVPWVDAHTVGRLMGEKLSINEFVAYSDMSSMMKATAGHAMGHQAEIIATFALCGFANFSSIAMQLGGIGEIAPSRRQDIARLGMKALACGTMASYLSATLAGLLS